MKRWLRVGNRKCFFGKLMLPEFTCGKLILPTHFQRAIFCYRLRVKSGKLMLPDVAILWVKLHLTVIRIVLQLICKPKNNLMLYTTIMRTVSCFRLVAQGGDIASQVQIVWNNSPWSNKMRLFPTLYLRVRLMQVMLLAFCPCLDRHKEITRKPWDPLSYSYFWLWRWPPAGRRAAELNRSVAWAHICKKHPQP